MKSKLRARPKNLKVDDVIEKLEEKGFDINRESMRSRSKSRRKIGDLEAAADKHAARALASDSDADDIIDDDMLAAEEATTRGRKRRRSRSPDADDYMDVDEGEDSDEARERRDSAKKRAMTPA